MSSRRRTAFADIALSISEKINTTNDDSSEYNTLLSNLEEFQNSPTTAYWFAYGRGPIAWNNIVWTPNRCPHELSRRGSGLTKEVLKSNCSIDAFGTANACECVFYEVEVDGKVTSLKNSYGNSLMPLLLEKVNNYTDLWEETDNCNEQFTSRQSEIILYYKHFASSFTRTNIDSLRTTNGTYVYNKSNTSII